MVEVIFVRSETLIGKIIRLFTGSYWNHCCIRDGDMVIECQMIKGVVLTPYKDIQGEKASRLVDVDPESVIQAARSQLGKGYDYWQVIGLGILQAWDDDERWSCADHVRWSFLVGAELELTSNSIWGLTPGAVFDSPYMTDPSVWPLTKRDG